jgi:hypothetical protein
MKDNWPSFNLHRVSSSYYEYIAEAGDLISPPPCKRPTPDASIDGEPNKALDLDAWRDWTRCDSSRRGAAGR